MDENEPVDDSEFVYRRIHPYFYDSRLPTSVLTEAFRPNQSDTSGISVFRTKFTGPQDTVANLHPTKASIYYVARLAVRALRNLGLTVVSDPVPGGPPGHAIIPELSWSAYEADKRRLKQIQFELAKLASADIVHGPQMP